ncbi:MAG: cysteine synthase A [Myxococcales bacterium]|nr:cysteine synthase A [Myxococcales bacterium]MCB9708595.1 cysteine synthase A [Myxococcales bacterium]
MAAPVVQSVLELIGNTPLLELTHCTPQGAATLWAKAEHVNPGGSVKDRICLSMIEVAEREGKIRPGDTIVEPTSGNTGIGLALVCAVKGYHLVLTMPESMSLERRALLQAYGAEIVLTQAERVMEGAIEAAKDIVASRGAFMPMQFDNPANPAAHAETTAEEIMRALEGQPVDAFVSAVGTGGTITGVGRVLKRNYPSCRIVAVEPETSPVLSGGEPGPTKIQGIGAGFVPGNFDPTVVDEIRRVSDYEAHRAKKALAEKAGLLVGISAGANVTIASRLAEELGENHVVVTVLCDTGERYFSLDTYFQEN